MTFEQFEKGKSADQIIDEVIQDLDRGLYDKQDHQEAIAKLLVARVTTLPESIERKKIDELLEDIHARFGSV